METPIKKDKSVFVVAIGFLLIMGVAALIFLKPSAQEKKDSKEIVKNSATDVEKTKGLESAELFKMTLRDNTLVLIDIRSPEEFNKEHIQNSKNIPASALAEALRSMEKDRTYIIVADNLSTEDLTSMADILQKNGIENYYYLQGGLAAWKTAFNPTVSEGDPRSFTDQAKVTYIKSDELKKLISTDPNLFIVDLRKSGQFKEGHIKNAVNIFLDNLESEKRKILPGRKVVLYDNDGLWAFKGAVRLYDLGFFNVLTLSDGLDTWKKNGFELVK